MLFSIYVHPLCVLTTGLSCGGGGAGIMVSPSSSYPHTRTHLCVGQIVEAEEVLVD